MKNHTAQRGRDESNLCTTCGNELQSAALACSFCNSPQSVMAARKQTPRPFVTINLKQGMPTVEQAMKRLDHELNAAVADGARVARIIHGWGSSGKGGAIRAEVRRRLGSTHGRPGAGAVVHGEDFSERSTAGRQLISQVPQLRTDRSNFENPGITLVALGGPTHTS